MSRNVVIRAGVRLDLDLLARVLVAKAERDAQHDAEFAAEVPVVLTFGRRPAA